MVINTPETPIQAEVIFLVEATAANGAFINELKTNYLVPTLEYFHGGALDEGGGTGSVYCVIAYRAADCHPGVPVTTYGPFSNPENVIETVDKIEYVGGQAESRACVAEALVTALSCLDELRRKDCPAHVLLFGCSPPYTAYAGGFAPPGCPATAEAAARALGARGALLSLCGARRPPALAGLYDAAGGDRAAHNRNYAKDPRHLVLLRGYSLKERPPSPAPPPAPVEMQPDVYTPAPRAVAPPRAAFPRGPPAAGPRWPPARPPLYANNSALLSQLAQPSYPPPPTSHAQQVTVPLMSPRGPPAAGPRWPPARPPLYANNSALLSQLAQPSYPPPPTSHAQQVTVPLMSPRGPPAAGPRWPPARPPLYANNSALLSQLAQPSYPPPPTSHAQQVTVPLMSPRGPPAAGPRWPPARPPLYANNSALLSQLAQPSYPPPPTSHAQQVTVPLMSPRGPPAAGPRWPPARPPLYANNSALLSQLAQPSYPPPPTSHAQQVTVPLMSPRGPPAAGPRWPPARPPLYANNSALLSQLAQPSYPPPPTSHAQQSGLPRMGGLLPGATPAPPAPLQRNFIWSGVLEWMEKGKSPGDTQKTTKHLPCQVSASSKDIEPELKADTWPNKLLMQLMPKQLISSIGGQYLKDSKSVLFHLHPNEALDALTKVMVGGFAGCVHFSPTSSPPQCDIKVLILLYTPDKKAYLGFIPNNQATFVDRLKKVIQQQKMSQIINKQSPAPGGPGLPPNMPSATMTGAGAMSTPGMSTSGMQNPGMSNPGMSNPGMSNPGMSNQGMSNQGMTNQSMSSQGMSNQGMSQQGMSSGGMSGGMGNMPALGVPGQNMQQPQMSHAQGIMMGGMGGQVGGMGGQVGGAGGGKGRGVPLDGLEAARQQNLEKIQHLQQTLEAAHQQEAQFKSQMDIMSHLHAAQAQEQHYKQMEEQQRKHQLQQQLQQQLRGAVPRLLRAPLSANPGLRHLLQQQPQYRPGGGAPRAAQPQQFDDVNNYDFI